MGWLEIGGDLRKSKNPGDPREAPLKCFRGVGGIPVSKTDCGNPIPGANGFFGAMTGIFRIFNFLNPIFCIISSKMDPETQICGLESTWDHMDRLRRTLLYRNFQRRAHHLSPDPNIFNPYIQNLEKRRFEDGGNSIQPKAVVYRELSI